MHYIEAPFFMDTKKSYIKTLFNIMNWLNVIKKIIRRFRPDFVITQGALVPFTLTVCRKLGIPVVVFLRSYIHFCPKELPYDRICNKRCIKCYSSFKEILKYPFERLKKIWHAHSLLKADILIANSKFMQKICKDFYGCTPKVVYPFIHLSDYIFEKTNGDKITIINPTRAKGGEIFLRIAQRLKTKKFLAVGRTDLPHIKKETNIEYIPPTNNIKEIYTQTKLLLVPSLWYEPFGRVCIETMANDIPCIASKRGGLVESVGKGGLLVENPYDIEEWISKIHYVENHYHEFQQKAKLHAIKFDFANTFKKFRSIIERSIGYKL